MREALANAAAPAQESTQLPRHRAPRAPVSARGPALLGQITARSKDRASSVPADESRKCRALLASAVDGLCAQAPAGGCGAMQFSQLLAEAAGNSAPQWSAEAGQPSASGGPGESAYASTFAAASMLAAAASSASSVPDLLAPEADGGLEVADEGFFFAPELPQVKAPPRMGLPERLSPTSHVFASRGILANSEQAPWPRSVPQPQSPCSSVKCSSPRQTPGLPAASAPRTRAQEHETTDSLDPEVQWLSLYLPLHPPHLVLEGAATSPRPRPHERHASEPPCGAAQEPSESPPCRVPPTPHNYRGACVMDLLSARGATAGMAGMVSRNSSYGEDEVELAQEDYDKPASRNGDCRKALMDESEYSSPCWSPALDLDSSWTAEPSRPIRARDPRHFGSMMSC